MTMDVDVTAMPVVQQLAVDDADAVAPRAMAEPTAVPCGPIAPTLPPCPVAPSTSGGLGSWCGRAGDGAAAGASGAAGRAGAALAASVNARVMAAVSELGNLDDVFTPPRPADDPGPQPQAQQQQPQQPRQQQQQQQQQLQQQVGSGLQAPVAPADGKHRPLAGSWLQMWCRGIADSAMAADARFSRCLVVEDSGVMPSGPAGPERVLTVWERAVVPPGEDDAAVCAACQRTVVSRVTQQCQAVLSQHLRGLGPDDAGDGTEVPAPGDPRTESRVCRCPFPARSRTVVLRAEWAFVGARVGDAVHLVHCNESGAYELGWRWWARQFRAWTW